MIASRLKELGIDLPDVVKPLASYVPAKRSGHMIYVSGQLPMQKGALMMTGALKAEADIEAAQKAMGQCFLNGLAAAMLCCVSDEIKEVIRLGAYVASGPDFFSQHLVANGASDLAQKIFGNSGIHARAAVGVPCLPLNSSVELEIIFRA